MDVDLDDLLDGDSDEAFRTRAALLIAILAMLLAITGVGGSNAAEDAIYNNVLASDTWAFFQAKNSRQTDYEIAADEWRLRLLEEGDGISAEMRAEIEALIDDYESTIARYESEPDPDDPTNPLKGEGKRELFTQAQAYEQARDDALAQDTSFDLAEAMFQIAIVLASVAILSRIRWLLFGAVAVGIVGFILMLNGFWLLFELPF